MIARASLIGQQFLVIAFILAVWWLAGFAGVLDTAILPPVDRVLVQVVQIVGDGAFRMALFNTVADAARGLAIAAIVGIPVGVLIGMFPLADRSTRMVLDFGRSFPVIALLPILVLMFGATATMKIIAISIACFFPILLQSIYGARRLEPTVVDTVSSFRIPPLLRFRKVLLPAAGPYIATGLRISTTVAILVAVGVEIVSLAPGMGREISLSRSYNQTDITVTYIVYAGLLGVVLNLIWDLLEKRFLGWHIRAQGE